MDETSRYLYDAWMETFEAFKPGARERVREAEEAYKDALGMLRPTAANVRKLVKMLNESPDVSFPMRYKDFEGVGLASEGRDYLEALYGILIFPKTLVVPRSEKGLLYKLDGDPDELGMTLTEVPYPFNKLGGISFIRSDVHSAHEDIHGANEVYRPEGGVEFAVLDEASACRDDVRRGDPLMDTWGKAYREVVRRSFPAIAETYGIPEEGMRAYRGPLKEAVRTVRNIERHSYADRYGGQSYPIRSQHLISREILSAPTIADFNGLATRPVDAVI